MDKHDDVIVKIDDLTQYFNHPEPVLDHISAQMQLGKITGIVGPDGAGKTTLIRLICGLLKRDQGMITVDGLDVQTNTVEIHTITGYMPQKFGLYEDLTVIENLRLYADLRLVFGEERQNKFARLLKFTDLTNFQTRLAGQLSGGMKQKLGLACALIGDPKLLLLDEPSVGVDPISRRELWKMVQELLTGGMAVVWSTAYLDEAEKCDQVILLNQGKSLYQGAPDELLQRVAGRVFQVTHLDSHERRATLMRLLGEKSVVDGVIQGSNIRIVLRKDAEKPALSSVTKDEQATWIAVPPRFEDCFMDILGGGPNGHSALAEHMPVKPSYTKPVVEAMHLRKCFGNFVAVKDNEFKIYRGEIFGLLGPNGAGKSTTFKMLCGLLQPTSGEAFIMGLNLRTASAAARSLIGYMAQKFSLYGHLTVMQNLQFFSGLYGLSGKWQQEQIDNIIAIFELKHFLNQRSDKLPLGIKQRLALGCAVMHEPDVLFLDEPTSGVDPITRREFWMHINGLVNKGVTVMVTTHFMDEAEYCDRIALIYRGENIASGTPDDLKASVTNQVLTNPTLEDAFIELVKRADEKRDAA